MNKKIEKIDIKSIKDPSFLKKMDYKSLNVLCEDIREEIIKEVSTYGGHLASNLGVVELTVALYKYFDFPKDKLLFDVGHQCYTHKILTGRSLEKLNSADGVSGFIKSDESKYDCFEAGHSSTALSAAEAFAVARDLKGETYDVVALVGDASIANGLSFEALNNIVDRKNKVIIVLNDNGMSISKPVGGLSKVFRNISTAKGYNRFKASYKSALSKSSIGKGIYSFSLYMKNKIKQWLVPSTVFDTMGFSYVGPVNGHDIKALEKAFKRAKHTNKSVIIHVLTQKGKGYKFAEEDQNGDWHSVKPFDTETGEISNNKESKMIHFSQITSQLIHQAMEDGEKNVLICPAMIKGSCLEKCFFDFPNRSFDMGISEEHATTFAGSLSLQGYHPILSIYSTFLQRSYDELSHDCARIKSDMTLLIDKAGLSGENGETHMGIYDEAFLKSIPNLIISMPSDVSEEKALFKLSQEKGHGVFAIRIPNSFTEFNEKDLEKEEQIPMFKWKFVQKGDDHDEAIIAVGPNGKKLFSILKEKKYAGTLINPLFLNPLDYETIDSILSCKRIIIYDAYGTEKGFTESVKDYLLTKSYQGEVKAFSLKNGFIGHDTIKNQEEKYHVSVNDLLDFIYKK